MSLADDMLGAVLALRASPDPRHPAWTTVARIVRAWCWTSDPLREDALQEVMIAFARSLPHLTHLHPLAIRRYIRRAWWSRLADLRRSRSRRRHHELAAEEAASSTRYLVTHGGGFMALDNGAQPRHLPFRVDGYVSPTPSPLLAPHRIDDVLDIVRRWVARLDDRHRSTSIHRVQAEAALLRVVCGLDVPEIATALGVDVEPATVWKWIDRGRAHVLDALNLWIDDECGDEWTEGVVDALRGLMVERRADAGVLRIERRKAT